MEEMVLRSTRVPHVIAKSGGSILKPTTTTVNNVTYNIYKFTSGSNNTIKFNVTPGKSIPFSLFMVGGW